jgi:hypothetical protein
MDEGIRPPRGLGDLVRMYQRASDETRKTLLEALFLNILSWEASENRCNCLNGPYPAHEKHCLANKVPAPAEVK